jgi:hypothetical protein
MKSADLAGMDTLDRDSNVIWFAEQCQTNAVRLDALIKSAELAGDRPLADFFRRAQAASGPSAAPAEAA